MSDDKRQGNGNGSHTPLEIIQERIMARLAEEPLPEYVTNVEEAEAASQSDPVVAWKRRGTGEPITLEQVHTGLIVASEFAQAAVEQSVKNGHAFQDTTERLDLLAEQFDNVRRDVQFIRDDLREVKKVTLQLSVIKDMLGEIIGRLPAPDAE